MDVQEVRAAALALPEAVEAGHFGRSSFRVRGKIFVTVHEDGRGVNLKLPRDEHEALVASQPDVFGTVIWGRLIRTSVRLEAADAGEIAELVQEAWRAVAPKRVVAAFDAGP
jgi:hypothetical protein